MHDLREFPSAFDSVAIVRTSARTPTRTPARAPGTRAGGDTPAVRPHARPHVRPHARVIIDHGRHAVTVDGHPVRLSVREADILLALAHAAGQAVRRADLERIAWPAPATGAPGPRALDMLVRRLRLKVAPIADALQAVRGVGYVLAHHPDLRVADDPAAPRR